MSSQSSNAAEINMVDSVRRRYIQSVLLNHPPPPSHSEPSRPNGTPASSQQQSSLQQPQQMKQVVEPTKPPKQEEDDMTMCFDMDDNPSDSPDIESSARDVSGGLSRVPNTSTAPTDFSAASSAQRTGVTSFGFVPPHLVAEQHDY